MTSFTGLVEKLLNIAKQHHCTVSYMQTIDILLLRYNKKLFYF